MQHNQGLLKIDLNALKANFLALRNKISPGTTLAASVKANGYGLGIAEVTETIHRAGGRDFFVATLDEGIVLRGLRPDAHIYVLGGFDPSGSYARYNLIPVLNTPYDINRYRESGAGVRCALHFDTGINRLGLDPDETKKLLESDEIKNLNIVLIMSHFACADEKHHPLTQKQYESFKKIAAHFPHVKKSLCNSPGIFREAHYHFDMVRPGMALYGLNPTPEAANPMKPVVMLESPVLQVRRAAKGESVGYGATYTLSIDTILATVGIGYGDGFLRSLGNKGRLYWKGHACPILGRVSMDLTTVDFSAVPENELPTPGDMMEILGPNQSADDLANDAGTIGYEILTSLGPRYRRIYID